MKQRFFAALTALALCLTLLPGTAWAATTTQEVTYRKCTESNGVLTWDNNAKATCEVAVSGNAKTWGDSSGEKWYVVNDNVTINRNSAEIGLTIQGNVHLILAPSNTLTIVGKLKIDDNSRLTIYGQQGGSGTLTVSHGENSSGDVAVGIVGSSTSPGSLTVHGGTVDADFKGRAKSEGIACPVTVYGGTVTSIVDSTKKKPGISGEVKVYGGKVNASGGANCTGIADKVTMNGGTVIAIGTGTGAGITGNVTVNGGKLNAYQGSSDINAITGSLTMTGGDVYAEQIGGTINVTGGLLKTNTTPGSSSVNNCVFGTNSNLKVYGNATANWSNEFFIIDKQTLTIPANSALTVPSGVTLTVDNKESGGGGKLTIEQNGTLTIEQNGTLDNQDNPVENHGTINGSGTVKTLCNDTTTYDGSLQVSKEYHDWNETAWAKDATNHWHKCKHCDAVKPETQAAHSGGTATCQAAKVCTVCGQSYGELAAHDMTTTYMKENADADKHYHVCTVCNTKDAGQEHTPGTEATETTPQTCTVCGYIIQAALGSYAVNITVDPAQSGTVTGGGSVTKGQSTTLAATANEGYEFLKWTENGSDLGSLNPYTFTPVKDMNITAVFQATETDPGTVAVTGVTLPATLALTTGTTGTLTATVAPDNATNKAVTWASNNGSVATVSGGTVTAVAPGNATITVTTVDGGHTATCTVTVTTPDPGPGPDPTPTPPGGGGGYTPPTYRPEVPETDGGQVSVSPKRPEKGDTVTITPKPDEGKEVEDITVTDKNGKPVEVTDNGDGTYSFKQPSGKVTIEVTFADKAPAPLPFTDVPADFWAVDAVRYVYENGMMRGTSATTFSPNGTTSRAMLVTTLWRMAGSPVVDYAMDYADVAGDAYYTEAVRWATANGIVGGYGGGVFGPNDPVSREQMATILYNFAKTEGKGFQGMWMFPLDFPDAEQVSPWAYEAMCWCTMSGIINGTDQGTLDPKAQATRAQVAAVLMRFCLTME